MNKRGSVILVILLTFCALPIEAQEIDNTLAYRNVNSSAYARLNIDNDVFTHLDEQYTSGENLELCLPALKKFPLSHLLLHPRFGVIKYGIGIEQAAYTPTYLDYIYRPVENRPYAGTLMLKTFVIAIDTAQKQQFASTLSTGIIGPAALADKFQDRVHDFTGNIHPYGWRYQIHNDMIVNYQVDYEKQLASAGNWLYFIGYVSARIGTLSDKASAGFTIMTGILNAPMGNQTSSKKFKAYLYCHTKADVIGYNATLQGGMFSHGNPYTISGTDISRLVATVRGGITLIYKQFTFEFYECYISKEFSGGPDHSWGGVQLAFAFR